MLVWVRGEDDNIVEVGDAYYVQEIAQDGVDESQKGSGSVGKAEWHDDTLVQAPWREESSLWNILGVHEDLVEGSSEIELRE